MRGLPAGPVSAVVLAAMLGLAGAAHAQVTVDPDALDALQPSPQAEAPAPAPPRRHAAPKAPAASPATSPGARTALPSVPPPAPNLPPPIDVPMRAAKPPPPPLLLPKAEGLVQPVPGGVRITFGPGGVALNEATLAALHEFARQVAPDTGLTVTINATAMGGMEDQSTPRRVSLSRGLAARSVLMSDGIPSDRITLRALGATAAPDAEPGILDRVDVLAYQRGAP